MTLPLLKRHFLALLLGTCLHAAQAAGEVPVFTERLADAALLAQIQQGGFVLYMRHGTTDNSRADQAPRVDYKDCNTQRVLNDDGRKLARDVGLSMRRAKIPVGEVFHSPMCRARETAELAFPALIKQFQSNISLAYTANLTTEEKKPVLAETRRLVSAPVAAGSNRLVVAHAPNLADLMGYFVKPEGTVVVIRPLGAQGYEYLGSIPPALWSQLGK
ncbi:MAG: hypothetical protein RL459_1946 [Pseudomonadota bacterium]|jgi:phosphohistidine phosphatase SixA